MSFEALKKEILAEAAAEAKAVSTRLEEQRATAQQRITSRARRTEERILGEAEAEADKQARHIHQEMELEARAMVLTAKQRELDATAAKLLEGLLAQDEAASTKLLSGLLGLLPETAGVITAGEHHKKLLAKLVKAPYSLSEDIIEGEGGFVFASDDTEMDLRLSQLVSQLFRKERAVIACILFG